MSVERGTDRVAANAARDRETDELMDVAARVERTLRPVPPRPAFRARLRDGLEMAAHQQQAHRQLSGELSEPSKAPHPLRGSWGWLIGAAALGSAAGVIAVVMRSRGQTPKSAAQPQAQP
jgi:hypothetical protein